MSVTLEEDWAVDSVVVDSVAGLEVGSVVAKVVAKEVDYLQSEDGINWYQNGS